MHHHPNVGRTFYAYACLSPAPEETRKTNYVTVWLVFLCSLQDRESSRLQEQQSVCHKKLSSRSYDRRKL